MYGVWPPIQLCTCLILKVARGLAETDRPTAYEPEHYPLEAADLANLSADTDAIFTENEPLDLPMSPYSYTSELQKYSPDGG